MAKTRWHNDHKIYMWDKFRAFVNQEDEENGWDPRGSSNDMREYFLQVTNDVSTPFGIVPPGKDQKLDETRFISNYKSQSKKFLASLPDGAGRSVTNAEIAQAARQNISLLSGGNSNNNSRSSSSNNNSNGATGGNDPGDGGKVADKEDEDSMFVEEGVSQDAAGDVVFPFIQCGYGVMHEDGRTEDKISIAIMTPAGWDPSLNRSVSLRTLELSDDGGYITISFQPSTYFSDETDAIHVLSYFEDIYAPHPNSGVMHPAVMELSKLVSEQQAQDHNHTIRIKLDKKCSRISSVEGQSKNNLGPTFCPYIRPVADRDEEEIFMCVLHIELDVENENSSRRANKKDIASLRGSEGGFSHSPTSWGSSKSNRHGPGSNGKRGGSFWQQGGGVSRGGSSLKSRRVHTSLSPPRNLLRSQKRASSLSPRNSDSPAIQSSTFERRSRADPPTVDSDTFGMASLSASLGEIDLGSPDNENVRKLEQRMSKMEKSQSQMMCQLKKIHDVLCMSTDEEKTSSSKWIDFIEKKLSAMDKSISQNATTADKCLSTSHDVLNDCICGLRESLSSLRKKTCDQHALHLKLVHVVEDIQNDKIDMDELKNNVETLKGRMEINLASISGLEEGFRSQQENFEAKLKGWGEAGEVLMADVKEMKEKQACLEAEVIEKRKKTSELYGHIYEQFDFSHTIPVTPLKNMNVF